MEDIIERLVFLRKDVGLSQEKFAQRLNISRGALANIEQRTRNLTNRVIADICREFEVNEDWLRNGTGEIYKPVADVDLELTSRIAKVLQSDNEFVKNAILLTVIAMSGMNESQQQDFEKVLIRMAEQAKEREQQKKEE